MRLGFGKKRERTDSTALLDDFFSDDKPTCSESSVNVLKKAANISGHTLYHAADFTRITFVTQTLIGRWLYQLFVELDRYEAAPDPKVQQSWLGWPIIGIAVAVSVLCKIYNYCKREDSAAAQDYVFAIFSSSMLYLVLDSFSDTNKVGSLHLGWFIAASVFVPLVSAISAKLVIPDSSNTLVVKPSQFRDEDNFPSYPDASRAEKALNILAGLGYGAAASIMVWVVNREVNRRTVPDETWQTIMSLVYYTISAAVGYKLTDYPRVFHTFAALSKTIRDSAFSYAAYSGIAFLALMTHHNCSEGPCWDENINMHLTWIFIPLSLSIGLYSGLSTLFQYEYNHEANASFINLAQRAGRKIMGCFESINCCKKDDEVDESARFVQRLLDAGEEPQPSCCARLFSSCHRGNSADAEAPSVALYGSMSLDHH